MTAATDRCEGRLRATAHHEAGHALIGLGRES
jgi:hypothetical protein